MALESRRKIGASSATVEQGWGQGQELLELLQVELEQHTSRVHSVSRMGPKATAGLLGALRLWLREQMERMIKAVFGVGDAGGAGGNMGWVRMVLPARDVVYALPSPASTPNQHKPQCTGQSTGQCGSVGSSANNPNDGNDDEEVEGDDDDDDDDDDHSGYRGDTAAKLSPKQKQQSTEQSSDITQRQVKSFNSNNSSNSKSNNNNNNISSSRGRVVCSFNEALTLTRLGGQHSVRPAVVGAEAVRAGLAWAQFTAADALALSHEWGNSSGGGAGLLGRRLGSSCCGRGVRTANDSNSNKSNSNNNSSLVRTMLQIEIGMRTLMRTGMLAQRSCEVCSAVQHRRAI